MIRLLRYRSYMSPAILVSHPINQRRIGEERMEENCTLTELVSPRVSHHTRIPQRSIGTSTQYRFAIVTVVSNQMRRCVMTRSLTQ